MFARQTRDKTSSSTSKGHSSEPEILPSINTRLPLLVNYVDAEGIRNWAGDVLASPTQSSYAYCPFHWSNKSPVRVNTDTISSFLVSYLVSSVPLLVSLSLFTKDVSRGGGEETRGERNQGNRDLINETSFALEPHFKSLAEFDVWHNCIMNCFI